MKRYTVTNTNMNLIKEPVYFDFALPMFLYLIKPSNIIQESKLIQFCSEFHGQSNDTYHGLKIIAYIMFSCLFRG